MIRKQYIFLFVTTISVSLFVFGCIYNVIGGSPWYANFMVQFFLNLPLCIGLGLIDFWFIHLVYKKLKWRNNALRILVDVLLTTLLAILLTYFLNFLLTVGYRDGWLLLRSSLPVVPWNWIIVLQIEIFFYHLQRSEMEKRLAVIEKEKALYQFEVLKNQINPHFLFNSLNVLASLAYRGCGQNQPLRQETVLGLPVSAHYAREDCGHSAGRTGVCGVVLVFGEYPFWRCPACGDRG